MLIFFVIWLSWLLLSKESLCFMIVKILYGMIGVGIGKIYVRFFVGFVFGRLENYLVSFWKGFLSVFVYMM